MKDMWRLYQNFFLIRVSEIYKILGILSLLFLSGLTYFVSTHIPLMSQFMFEWQVEKLGLRATCFGKVQAKWGDAQFEDVRLVPLHKNLSEVGKNSCRHHHILLKFVKVQYRLKDFIRLRFRHLIVDGISGGISIDSNGAWSLRAPPLVSATGDLRETLVPSSPSKGLEKHTSLEKEKGTSFQKSASIIVKNAHFLCDTPYGTLTLKGDMNMVDFLTRMVLGTGHVTFQTPVGNIEGTLKIDKIEGRLWRLTVDTQGNTLFLPQAKGTDTKVHLEVMLNGYETNLNGFLTASHLSFSPEHQSLNLYMPRSDFKFVYDFNQQFKGDIIVKVLSMESDSLVGRDVDGTMTCEGKNQSLSSLHGEWLLTHLTPKDSPAFLKPFSFRTTLDYKPWDLKFEAVLNANPLVLASQGHYDLKKETAEGVIASLPLEMTKTTSLEALSPYLGSFFKNVEGTLKLKGDFKWEPQKSLFTPQLTLKLKDLSFTKDQLSVAGLNGDLTFTHFFPLTTAPHQELTLEKVSFPTYKLKNVKSLLQIDPSLGLKIETFSALLKGRKLSFKGNDSPFLKEILKSVSRSPESPAHRE